LCRNHLRHRSTQRQVYVGMQFCAFLIRVRVPLLLNREVTQRLPLGTNIHDTALFLRPKLKQPKHYYAQTTNVGAGTGAVIGGAVGATSGPAVSAVNSGMKSNAA
jgi:hypothetical protein